MYISAAEMYILAREMYISRREIKFISYVDRFSEQAEYVFLPYLPYLFPNVKRREYLHGCPYHLGRNCPPEYIHYQCDYRRDAPWCIRNRPGAAEMSDVVMRDGRLFAMLTGGCTTVHPYRG